jgi:hypothetical protein
MVPVAAHQSFNLCVPVETVVLVPHKHANGVSRIKQSWCGRIMSGAPACECIYVCVSV